MANVSETTSSYELPRRPPATRPYASMSEASFSTDFLADVSTDTQKEDSNVYTVDSAIDAIGMGPFQYIVLLLAGLCWTAESMEMLLLSFIKQPLQCQWDISDRSAAFITTCVAIGMLFGSIVWGVVADRFGRRFAFIVSTAFTGGMGILSALSINYSMLLIARGFVGFGIGGVPVAFSLLMEFLPSAQRGSWGMSLALFWAVGAMFEAIVALFVLPTMGWRWLITFSTLPLLFVLLSSVWLSESPRWLASRGELERADRTLNRIALVNRSSVPTGRLVVTQLDPNTEQSIQQDVNDAFAATDAVGSNSQRNHSTPDDDYIQPEEGAADSTVTTYSTLNSKNSGISSLLRRGARGLTIKILAIWFVSAFVYYGLVMLQPEMISTENQGIRCKYASAECGVVKQELVCASEPICSWTQNSGCIPTGLLQQNSESSTPKDNNACARKLTTDDFVSTLWGSVGEMPGVLIAFVVVDIIGRRPLVGYLFGLLCVSFLSLFFCLSRIGETAIFFIARGASSGSFQAIYLFANEVYPASVRATAMGLSSAVARIGLLITPFIAQYLINIDQKAALGAYALSAALAFMCSVLLPIETTGRVLFTSMDELTQALREARLRRAEPGTSFAKDPSVHPIVRFLRWNALLDGVPVK